MLVEWSAITQDLRWFIFQLAERRYILDFIKQFYVNFCKFSVIVYVFVKLLEGFLPLQKCIFGRAKVPGCLQEKMHLMPDSPKYFLLSHHYSIHYQELIHVSEGPVEWQVAQLVDQVTDIGEKLFGILAVVFVLIDDEPKQIKERVEMDRFLLTIKFGELPYTVNKAHDIMLMPLL